MRKLMARAVGLPAKCEQDWALSLDVPPPKAREFLIKPAWSRGRRRGAESSSQPRPLNLKARLPWSPSPRIQMS